METITEIGYEVNINGLLFYVDFEIELITENEDYSDEFGVATPQPNTYADFDINRIVDCEQNDFTDEYGKLVKEFLITKQNDFINN